MEKRFRPEHFAVSVSNLERSMEWYQSVLGFEPERTEYAPPMHSRVGFMNNNGFRIEIFEHDQKIPVPEDRKIPNLDIQTGGTKHICLEHDDIPALAEELRNSGVDIVFGPVCNGVQHMMFIRDPDGILIELVSAVRTYSR